MIIGEETEVIEFDIYKKGTIRPFKAIVAMLNKHSKGVVYFGVDDNGFVQGQQISDSTKKDIAATISELIEPKISPSIELLRVEGKDIIKVSFSGHNRPYSCQGKYLIRVGSENKKMSGDDLKRLIKHDEYASKWEDELTEYSLDELDDRAIMDFYKSATSCGRLSMPVFEKEKLLANLDLLENGKVKNGCYALFGKEAKIGLKLASYATDNKVTFTDLKLINGNIYNLLTDAINYVLSHIDWNPEIGSRKRVDVPEIPEMAVREIIVNAFAHSDYEVLPEIEIGIYPSVVEIYNPGPFPDELTPLDFISKNLPSYKRNRLILDILFRSKDVEKSGTGFQRVNQLCNQAGISWSYRKEAYGFFFEFIRNKVDFIKDGEEKDLNQNEKKILSYIKATPNMSKKEMALRIEKSEKTVQRTLESLTEKALITRIGSKKTGHWEATK